MGKPEWTFWPTQCDNTLFICCLLFFCEVGWVFVENGAVWLEVWKEEGQFGELIVEHKRIGWQGQCIGSAERGWELFDLSVVSHSPASVFSVMWLFPTVLWLFGACHCVNCWTCPPLYVLLVLGNRKEMWDVRKTYWNDGLWDLGRLKRAIKRGKG